MAVFSVLVFLIIAVAHLDVAGTSKITVLDEQVLWKAGQCIDRGIDRGIDMVVCMPRG